MGAQVSVRFTRLGLASASPVGPTAVSFASQGPSPALGVGDFRESGENSGLFPSLCLLLWPGPSHRNGLPWSYSRESPLIQTSNS